MENEDKTTEIMHDIKGSTASFLSRKILLILLVTAFVGLGSGYLLSKSSAKSGSTGLVDKMVNKAAVKKGQTFGSDDMTIYTDMAEGVLKEGGVADEGQYHLVRPGGESQNVYLTSSLVDLAKFIDRKIKVWGQTQKAQKAGWLMDVGKVEVL